MRRSSPSGPKFAIIGGGNGPYIIGTALGPYNTDLGIFSTPADDGGSSGRIRDEFGNALPHGDMRRGIMALMDSGNVAHRAYFDHRIEGGGKELTDHSLGNIMLLAAEQMFGPIDGVRFVGELFNIRGTVLPLSIDNTRLVAELSDGNIVHGESAIDRRSLEDHRTIKRVWLEPKAYICRPAKEAIEEAHFVVMGLGDLVTSTHAAQLVKGVNEALKRSSAKLICVPSLMTKWSETRGFSTTNFVEKIIEYGIGRDRFDYLISNNKPAPGDLLEKYKQEDKSTQIIIDANEEMGRLHELAQTIHSVDLLSEEGLRHGLIRHDPRKLGHAIMQLTNGRNYDFAGGQA